MRELALDELALVAGGETLVCPRTNSYGGVSNPGGFGQDIIDLYEGLVFATAHIMERIGNAL
jgi:hypothetical protein